MTSRRRAENFVVRRTRRSFQAKAQQTTVLALLQVLRRKDRDSLQTSEIQICSLGAPGLAIPRSSCWDRTSIEVEKRKEERVCMSCGLHNLAEANQNMSPTMRDYRSLSKLMQTRSEKTRVIKRPSFYGSIFLRWWMQDERAHTATRNLRHVRFISSLVDRRATL